MKNIKNYQSFNEELETFQLLLLGSSAISTIVILLARLQNSNNLNKVVQNRVDFDKKLKEIAIKVGSDDRLVNFLQKYRDQFSDNKMTLSEMTEFKKYLNNILSEILTVDESDYLIELVEHISTEFGGNEKKSYNCGICRGPFLAFPSQQSVVCPHCKRINRIL